MKYVLTRHSDRQEFTSDTLLGVWMNARKAEGVMFATRICLTLGLKS
ncbi:MULTISPECIES: hypothetical protein [Vibrio]|nr:MULTISPECIES: hypothetical protein [Vibrio]USD35570.1 hypothetical protein J8Z27_22420 [Vibrio sp. SCSIO 43186]USD72694.1 hypothetical protein J4N41_22435 [Vibrio sp. SCSIO 43139]